MEIFLTVCILAVATVTQQVLWQWFHRRQQQETVNAFLQGQATYIQDSIAQRQFYADALTRSPGRDCGGDDDLPGRPCLHDR